MADQPNFDVIVVGSGMSGGYAAKEFAERGMKVLVIERGKDTQPGKDYVGENLDPWDMEFRDKINPQLAETDYEIQSKCYALRESNRNLFINDRENPYSTEADTPFYWIRGDQVGGKSLMWARQSYRWSDLDFGANKADGHGTDWPIRYADIEKWYDTVEDFVGISGSVENLPHLPDSRFQPAMDMTCVEIAAKEAIESSFPERNLIIGRVAQLTKPTEEQLALGRGPCQFRNQCNRGCSFGAYYSSVSGSLPAAARTGNMTMMTDTMVEQINYDPQTKRATGVRVVNRLNKEREDITARVVFLCASTVGSLQVMLNSTSEAFPEGFANSSGVLGTHVMDHHYQIGANGKIPGYEDDYFFGNRPNGIYVPRFRNLGNETDNEFVRGYGYQGGSSRSSWTRALGGTDYGADMKESLRQPGPWTFTLHGFGEQLPMADNTVTLHPTQTDPLGIPQVHMNVRYTENELKMREAMKADAVAMLEAAGAVDVKPFDRQAVPGHCIHEMGGARMGHDPATSVLNSYNQCHDVANVFVTDGAAFSSISCVNPSLTFMALTARAADYATQQMKDGLI